MYAEKDFQITVTESQEFLCDNAMYFIALDLFTSQNIIINKTNMDSTMNIHEIFICVSCRTKTMP